MQGTRSLHSGGQALRCAGHKHTRPITREHVQHTHAGMCNCTHTHTASIPVFSDPVHVMLANNGEHKLDAVPGCRCVCVCAPVTVCVSRFLNCHWMWSIHLTETQQDCMQRV
jgi:hypothetical protein